MTDLDQNTEQLIFRAARKVFTLKGYNGARMQEIADEAGINKALLHYYFRNKDKLFEGVFGDVLKTLFPGLTNILTADLPLFEKIPLFVCQYIDILTNNPEIAGFVLYELRLNPQRLVGNMRDIGIDMNLIRSQIESEVAAGIIRPVKPEHLIANLISMTIFPFIARPVLMSVAGMDEVHYTKFIEERKRIVPETIIQSLKPIQ
ncbi:transcriptional regulator, TetR family [Lentimicrobium saccharophilum]|uniref:Transcriptional regulator, TetR family n=1 Tax=Lentimicrobium saccharophilum TaxID=1678841 RepID=A0A0S7BZN3_9BACT|nr:transcriptional regulator, TetR family [Lentimicrobium saccharophilum]